ncbi:MAG: glycosyl hydrolase [Gemmatimonadetes bacterium]|nr:glycosyl hydrolase [Gemmatimonadota bacterium]
MPALPRLAPSTRAFARPLQALALATFVVPVALVAQPRATAPARSAVDTTALARLTFRSIGPANMMGRSTDVEGVAGNANLVYVGTAAGGVWKTTNGGTTWAPLFDKQPTLSIGDLALEPGNPDVIYAGTGEANVRNSVSFGRGMYKSTDGGRSWRFIGLGDTRHIARVMVNPADTRTVYTCAVGHMAGPNAERGVFVSRDGGTTWSKTLYVDDKHGCADLDVDPKNPNIVYAAMWLFDRKQWTFTSGSEQGGIYKSVDGGQTWRKLGGGLPKLLGRVGIKVAPSSPNTVYAITESKEGFVYRSDDFGETWRKTSDDSRTICRGFYYSDLRVDPQNPERVYSIACNLMVSIDGARTFRPIGQTVHGDHHGLWIDPAEPTRLWDVNDGGIAESRDHGATWRFPNVFPLAQFYQLHADNREPFYHLGGGLQDNGNWVGPSRTRDPLGILVDDWQLVSYGDGYYQTSHPDDPDFIITDSQGGMIWRTQMRTREQEDISPQPRRNDGAPVNALQYRFNWNAPIVASPHDGKVVYFGAQVLFRSKDFGATWQAISPDLSRNDTTRHGWAGGPAMPEATTAEYYNTIYSIAESPAQKGIIWVGVDDGNLHVTKDDGATWTRVDRNVPGVGLEAVVSHVEASRTAPCTAYATFERKFMDDLKAYAFRTTDCGATWTSIAGNLPEGAYLQVLREDPKNPQVLYAGTETGLFVSVTGGNDWFRLGGNLPAVPVHEVLVHGRENDLIVATHARGIWILDDASAIQELAAAAAKPAHLFAMRTATRFATKQGKGSLGNALFMGPNPAYGAIIRYHLKERPAAATTVKAEILDGEGKVVRTLARVPREAGINTTAWDLSYEPARPRAAPSGPEGEGEAIMRRLFGAAGGPRALPGRYTVRLTVGDQTLEQPLTVRVDPTSKTTPEALRGQFIVAVELRDLLSLANDTLRALDGRRGELEAKRRAAVAIPNGEGAAAARQIAGELAQVDSLLDLLVKPATAPQWSDGPRISERIAQLLQKLDQGNQPPTQAQQKLGKDLAVELRDALERVRKYLGRFTSM